jgi:gluconolactonase
MGRWYVQGCRNRRFFRRFSLDCDATEGKLGPMNLATTLGSVTVALSLIASGCGKNETNQPTDAGGTGGSVVTAGSGGSMGSMGSGGMSGVGSGGTPANDDAGPTGTGGAPMADGGGADVPAVGPHKQFTCPAGPFPAQMMVKTMPACVGFKFAYGYHEGPTWIASEDAFFFSDFVHANPGGMAGGDIIKVPSSGGPCEVWAHDVGTNGLAVGATGNIIAACHKTRSITEFNIKTKEARIVADMYMGMKFDSPNDVVVHHTGNIYFSNPSYELGGRPPGGIGGAFIRIDPLGVVSIITKTGGQPNGIGLSPDEKLLYTVGGGTWNIDENGVPTDRAAGAKQGGGDGFAVDCAGNISMNGTNSAFGGADGKLLIIVGGGVTIATMTVPGLP